MKRPLPAEVSAAADSLQELSLSGVTHVSGVPPFTLCSELLGNSNDKLTSNFTLPLSTASMMAILVANDIAERLALPQPREDRPTKRLIARRAAAPTYKRVAAHVIVVWGLCIVSYKAEIRNSGVRAKRSEIVCFLTALCTDWLSLFTISGNSY